MKRTYKPLFSLRVSHAYYAGRCDDFAFVLPAETTRLMSGGRLRSRVLDGTLQVFFEADGAGALARPLPAGALRIGLKLTNPNLYNFTAPESLPQPGAVACYGNRTSRRALDAPESRKLVGSTFTHALSVVERPATATLRDASGAPLRTVVVHDATQGEVSFGALGAALGGVTLEESTPGAPTLATRYEVHPELLAEGVFSVVTLAHDADFAASPPDFEVALAARREALRYYVVARRFREDEVNQLSVVDGGAAADGRDAVTFTRVRPDAFSGDDLPASLLAQDEAQLVLFRSNVVARCAAARRRISLRRNSTDLVASLPQPAADRPHAHMIIHVSL